MLELGREAAIVASGMNPSYLTEEEIVLLAEKSDLRNNPLAVRNV